MTSGPSATAPRVVVVQHEPDTPAGLVGDWLQEVGVELDVRHPYRGDPLPGADAPDLAGLLVLGGSMGATDDDVAPWLPAVRALMADATDRGVPVWGLCLGGQLLAAATGGRVERGADPELGVLDVRLLDVASDDPLLAGLPATAPVFQYHQDGIAALPPAAVALASSATYPHQAFRLGACAWGVQFHPEVTPDIVEDWGRDDHHLLPRTGRSLDEVVTEMHDRIDELVRLWRPVAHRFAAVVQERSSRLPTTAAASPGDR